MHYCSYWIIQNVFFGEIDVMKTNVSFSVEWLQNPALECSLLHPSSQ